MANLTITPANLVITSSQSLRYGISGVAIAQGDSLYIDLTDSNKMKLAIATSAAASVFAGVAVCACAANQSVAYVPIGGLTIGSTLGLGLIYCVSATAGKICPYADLVTGNYVSVIGMPTTTAILDIYPKNSGIAKP